jgi:hypothetical protein
MIDDSFRFPGVEIMEPGMPPRFGVKIAHGGSPLFDPTVNYANAIVHPEPQSREFVRLEILDQRKQPLSSLSLRDAHAQVFLVQQFQQFEGEFEFCNRDFPFVQRITAIFEDDGVVITVGTRVDDRANHRRAVGSPIEVFFRMSIPWAHTAPSAEPAALLVHRAIKEAIVHEVAENFYVNGRRPFDPHKDESR